MSPVGAHELGHRLRAIRPVPAGSNARSAAQEVAAEDSHGFPPLHFTEASAQQPSALRGLPCVPGAIQLTVAGFEVSHEEAAGNRARACASAGLTSQAHDVSSGTAVGPHKLARRAGEGDGGSPSPRSSGMRRAASSARGRRTVVAAVEWCGGRRSLGSAATPWRLGRVAGAQGRQG
eukprot:scaffold84_cov388-Prasinococcus_capsulatus_cf.AAC.3